MSSVILWKVVLFIVRQLYSHGNLVCFKWENNHTNKQTNKQTKKKTTNDWWTTIFDVMMLIKLLVLAFTIANHNHSSSKTKACMPLFKEMTMTHSALTTHTASPKHKTLSPSVSHSHTRTERHTHANQSDETTLHPNKCCSHQLLNASPHGTSFW